MKCLDSTFLIDLLRNEPAAVAKAKQLAHEEFVVTPIIVHEVMLGIFFAKPKFVAKAMELLSSFRLLDLSFASSTTSANIGAALLKSGKEVGDGDLLTAGAMLANNCDIIITRDTDFKRIKGITVEPY